MIESYLDHRRARYAKTTVDNESFVLRRFLAEVGDLQLRHLRPAHVERWFTALLDEDTSRNGVVRKLADAYVEVLDLAERVSHWAAQVRPVLDTDPPQVPPPLPDLSSQARVEALVNAFGSEAVRDRMDAWRAVVQAIIRADRTIGIAHASMHRHGRTGIDEGDVWLTLENELRPAERERRKELADAIAKELGHRERPGSWWRRWYSRRGWRGS